MNSPGIARVSSTTTARYFHLYAIPRAAWNNLIEFAMLAPSEQARQEGANVASTRMKGLSARKFSGEKCIALASRPSRPVESEQQTASVRLAEWAGSGR